MCEWLIYDYYNIPVIEVICKFFIGDLYCLGNVDIMEYHRLAPRQWFRHYSHQLVIIIVALVPHVRFTKLHCYCKCSVLCIG